jgi:hypothetical protein
MLAAITTALELRRPPSGRATEVHMRFELP